jgi:predicted nucleic acid-binding protein
MAGNARYTALLDACVLYPIAIADSLLSLATADLFAAKWTTRIENEWLNALEQDRPDLKGKLTVRRDCMREAVPDWEVLSTVWEPLVGSIKLPDEGDAHVLAAAIAGHADCIVTSNIKHFPMEAVRSYGIEVIDPDTFIINQLDLSQIRALGAFKRMRERRKKPASTPIEFADALERAGLPATAQRLREAAELL